MAELVDRLDPQPTYVTGRNWDVLGSNRAAHALFADWPAKPAVERNLLWFMFADPRARYVYVEWGREAAAQLGRFRAAGRASARRPRRGRPGRAAAVGQPRGGPLVGAAGRPAVETR